MKMTIYLMQSLLFYSYI